jgi:hypothetical protein
VIPALHVCPASWRNIAITLIIPQKGEGKAHACEMACSIKGDVKKILLPRPEGGFRDIQPLSRRKTLVWCHAPGLVLRWSISAAASSISSDDADRFQKLSKPCGCTVSTMGLSEARGLVLFRVLREGIGVTRRLGAGRHRVDYRPLAYSPSNPSVSRTDRPPPEKITRDGRGSLHETLKRLAILVFLRRSFLPSSTVSA